MLIDRAWPSPYVYTCNLKVHMHMLKQSTSEFGGLWKHQNNSAACTNCARGFRVLKLDIIRKKKSVSKDLSNVFPKADNHQVSKL